MSSDSNNPVPDPSTGEQENTFSLENIRQQNSPAELIQTLDGSTEQSSGSFLTPRNEIINANTTLTTNDPRAHLPNSRNDLNGELGESAISLSENELEINTAIDQRAARPRSPRLAQPSAHQHVTISYDIESGQNSENHQGLEVVSFDTTNSSTESLSNLFSEHDYEYYANDYYREDEYEIYEPHSLNQNSSSGGTGFSEFSREVSDEAGQSSLNPHLPFPRSYPPLYLSDKASFSPPELNGYRSRFFGQYRRKEIRKISLIHIDNDDFQN